MSYNNIYISSDIPAIAIDNIVGIGVAIFSLAVLVAIIIIIRMLKK